MTEMEEYIRTKLDVFLLLSGLWVELIIFRTPMLDTPPSLFLRPLLLQIHHILYYLHSTRTGRCTTPGQHSSHRRRNRSCLGNSAYLGKHASQQVSNKVLSREREPFFFSSFKQFPLLVCFACYILPVIEHVQVFLPVVQTGQCFVDEYIALRILHEDLLSIAWSWCCVVVAFFFNLPSMKQAHWACSLSTVCYIVILNNTHLGTQQINTAASSSKYYTLVRVEALYLLFRIAVPIWGQNIWNQREIVIPRQCSSERVQSLACRRPGSDYYV